MNIIWHKLDSLLQEKESVVIAIDGNCGAGKSTLAQTLVEKYDCNIFHMDDFFLRPEQRTDRRLTEPGGNVDYERFYEEVLVPLKKGVDFSYSPYNCKTCTLDSPIAVCQKHLAVVEGTYSLHPYFNKPYDCSIFLEVSEQLQKERILKRPVHLHARFFNEWIPMENNYFEAFNVKASCDMVLRAEDMLQFAT